MPVEESKGLFKILLVKLYLIVDPPAEGLTLGACQVPQDINSMKYHIMEMFSQGISSHYPSFLSCHLP